VTRGALELYDRRYARPVYEQKMRNMLELLRVRLAADRRAEGRLDALVDGINGYAFTLVVLALLTPVVMIRPVLMLLTRVTNSTATTVRIRLARRRLAPRVASTVAVD
jgi:hypothetical protein